ARRVQRRVHARRGGVHRGVRQRAVRGGRHRVPARYPARAGRQPDRASQGPPAPRVGGRVMPAAIGTHLVTMRFGNNEARTLAGYEKTGGYGQLRKALAMRPDDITNEVKASNLRGRGGAGFSTGVKWGFVPKDAKAVHLVCNADESEPGTCKDRELMFWDPHLLIEGMVISAHALKAVHNFIYIRGEMMKEYLVLQKAVEEAYSRGYLGKSVAGTGMEVQLTVHRGAGAYICGEETALLNSLEGLRGQPRLKPPFPAVKGLFGNPTIVNNVETLMNVPFIIEKGGAWFNALGMG